MVELMEFIFGGTALWGLARFGGVCVLLLLILLITASLTGVFSRLRK